MSNIADLERFGGITDGYFDDDFLMHYGVGKEDGAPGRGSGRYELGSGDNPFQRRVDFYNTVNRLRKEGKSDKEIAAELGCLDKFGNPSTGVLRTRYSNATQEQRAWKAEQCYKLRQQGLGWTEIGEQMGMNESSVRSAVASAEKNRVSLNKQTAEVLKPYVDQHKYVDVGSGIEVGLGVSETRLKNALILLEEEGYKTQYVKIDQMGTNHQTTIRVLTAPGVSYDELYKHRYDISTLGLESKVYNENNELTSLGMLKPRSVDSNRVMIRYNEEGGLERDGLIQLRRGVDDTSLGNSQYAQVRVAVDDTHYMKGMAVYADDKEFPPGIDIIYNSKKHVGTDKYSVFKEMKHVEEDNPNSPIDWANPFGASIKPVEQGGQRYYLDSDGTQKLSVINKVNDQGDWQGWSKTLASQFLSKQPIKLAERQLDNGYLDKKAELEEIKNLTNNTVKKKLLLDFAEDADAAAVELKAAPFARQQSHTILPFPDISEKEIFAPNYEDGTRVVLIRYPHGGTFEIPELTVHNTGSPANKIIHNAPDAVGINSKVAQQLSGADFDGDTVMVIPLSDKVRVRTRSPLEGLKDFDHMEEYAGYPGMKVISPHQKQVEMGVVTNLITDMTIKGASEDELARAVRHSMVIIDAEKHKLDYKRSEKDNDIDGLKRKYQSRPDGYGGASTIISKASSEQRVPDREDWSASSKSIAPDGSKIQEPTGKGYETAKLNGFELKSGGRVKVSTERNTGKQYYMKEDLKTGKKTKVYVTQDDFLDNISTKKSVYLNTDKEGRRYYLREDPVTHKKVRAYITDTDVAGEIKTHGRQVESTKMAEATDAFTLTSGGSKANPGYPIERVYANYANNMKALAREARKEWLATENPKKNVEAAQKYKAEVESIDRKLALALANSPRERQAQLLANRRMDIRKANNPGMTKEEIQKYKGQSIVAARAEVGAKKPYITLTDREWEAIEAGAITHTKLDKILKNSDMEKFKQLATPRTKKTITPTMKALAKSMEASGHDTNQIANRLGISVSSVYNILNGKEAN